MPQKVQLKIPVFGGENVLTDPAQLGPGSPYMLNWMPDWKNTTLRTRGGFTQVARLNRATISSIEVPTLFAVYLRDFGITGNVFFVASGTDRDRLIAQAQHAFNDGTVFGSGADGAARKTRLFPAATPAGNWQAGADIGENQREQIDWFAAMFALYGRLLVFMPHQIPIHVYPDPTGAATVRPLGLDDPVVKPTVAAGSGSLSGDYKYIYTFYNDDELFLSESVGSIPSDTVSPSSQGVVITAAAADDHMPSFSDISGIVVYRRKVSTEQTWSNYYRVAAITVAQLEAGSYTDDIADTTVVASDILNTFKASFRGFGIAHGHGGRVYAGYQNEWRGKITIDAGKTFGVLSPASGTASESYYRDFIGQDRQILIRDTTDGATYSLNILRSWRDSTDNKINFAADDRLSVKNYPGSATATALDCRIPGDRRTIYAGYQGPGYASYRDVRYEILPGKDSDGELTGLTSLRNDLLACYQNALFLISGGDFADVHNNGDVFPDWRWRYLTQRMGLIAPKTLASDPVGRVYGFAGPAGGVWRTDGLSIQSISNDMLSDRLNEFAEQKFATGYYDPVNDRYHLCFPYSGDDHGFIFDFDNSAWSEVNHLDIFAPPQTAVTMEGIQPVDLAGSVPVGRAEDPIVDNPPTPDDPPDEPGPLPPDAPPAYTLSWQDWPPGA